MYAFFCPNDGCIHRRGPAARRSRHNGAGVATCAEFGEAYQRDPGHVMAFYFSWAQGAMSNTNMLKKALKQSQRDLNGLPVSEQMDRLRMFCDRRPLAYFGDAVIKLFYELPEISPQSN